MLFQKTMVFEQVKDQIKSANIHNFEDYKCNSESVGIKFVKNKIRRLTLWIWENRGQKYNYNPNFYDVLLPP